jgi:YegS/Rv2252/BmrU family lipid kinase
MNPVKILIFINPNSGTDTKADPKDLIVNVLNNKKVSYTITEITPELDQKQIKSLIKNYDASIAVAAGGDGTVNTIASALIGLPVSLGILPLGSANGLAYELGIPLKLEDAIEVLFSGKAQPLDAVKIDNNHISLHLSDLGMNARVIKEFEKEGKRGFLGYFKHFFKEIKSPRSFKCTIEIKSDIYHHRSLMTVIANSGSYRSGAVINPTGEKDDGFFEIIVLKPRRNWIIRNTIAAFTGSFHNEPNINTYKCASAKIKVFPQQELQVDGELLGKTNEVKPQIIKHAIKVIVP